MGHKPAAELLDGAVLGPLRFPFGQMLPQSIRDVGPDERLVAPETERWRDLFEMTCSGSRSEIRVMGLSVCMLRWMRSLIFIASPFHRLRQSGGDEAEHIAFSDHMDDVQQAVVGGESNTGLPCLFCRAGVLVAGQWFQTKICPSSVENTSI